MSDAPYALAVAAMFRDEAPYLAEWVAYHRAVGVEHFWLYDDASVDGWREALSDPIDDGVVEVIDWPSLTRRHQPGRQVEAFRDALARARSQARWLALIDVDEFILPRREPTVPACLERHFAEAAAVFVNWRNFGTGGVRLGAGESLLLALTASSDPDHPRNAVGKSIVRPHRVCSEETWSPHHCVLEAGARYFDGDAQVLVSGASEPLLDGRRHDSLLRINHYAMRDEGYFHTTRLARAEGWGGEAWLEWEHYHAFSAGRDQEMIEFLDREHPRTSRALVGEHLGASEALGRARGAGPQPTVPYVTAQIYGRLGNNMFQIAAASALAWDHGAEPRFPEISPSSPLYRHRFFRCNIEAPDTEPEYEWNEPSYAYAPIPFHPNMRLVGYFQSERHFAHHRERIRELFAPGAGDLAYIEGTYGELLADPRTVGVQLRCYRAEGLPVEVFPQYGHAYLAQAAALFPEDAVFVLSSDDLDYARASLPAAMKHAVVIEGEADHIDQLLLSRCRNNIISNSSFGWWAAWLNPHEGRRVVRPLRWLHGHPIADVCPGDWIALDAPED